MSQPREFDIVLLGATGFTGRQAAGFLRAHPDARALKLCFAGRDPTRLAAVSAGTPLRVVDTRDVDAVERLAASTRVLVTTVGPYARYGDAVVDACARNGTDYLDITGETPWVRRVIERLDALARQTGARIVPFCGFDSVPSDLGAYMMVQALRERHDEGTVEVRSAFRIKGGLNGGTMATALMLAEPEHGEGLFSPYVLVPTRAPGVFDEPRVAAAMREDLRPHPDEALGGWVAPFVMAPVNGAVVRRSQALWAARGEPYGAGFVYQEGAAARGPLRAWAFTAGGLLIGLGARWRWLRRAAERFVPKPGEGPTEAQMDDGWFRVVLVARGERGTQLRGRILSQGDPGNRSTVRMLCSAALSLALGEAAPGGGVLTPSVALGLGFLDRLRREGMEWVVEPAAS